MINRNITTKCKIKTDQVSKIKIFLLIKRKNQDSVKILHKLILII